MGEETKYRRQSSITSEESHKLGQQMNQAIHIQLEARLVLACTNSFNYVMNELEPKIQAQLVTEVSSQLK